MRKSDPALEMRNVRNYKGYIKSKELENRIRDIVKGYPQIEKYVIVDQVLRASRDIAKNIASAEQMYIRKKYSAYSIAIGGCKEVSTWLDISLNQQYITSRINRELNDLCMQVVAILTKTLANIRDDVGNKMDLPSPYTPVLKNYDVYNKSLTLVDMIYKMTDNDKFKNEKRLKIQLRKMVTSVSANISESNQLYIEVKFRFLNNVLYSLSEMKSGMDTCLDNEYMTEKEFEEIENLCLSIEKMIKSFLANKSKERRKLIMI